MAGGKAILAFLPDDEQAAWLAAHDFAKRTPRTIGSRAELERQLPQIAKTGFAYSDSEYELGAVAIGVPVFDRNKRPVGALSVTFPMARDGARRRRAILKVMSDAAKVLERQLRA